MLTLHKNRMIMNAPELRQQLHNQIDKLDDKSLQRMFSILQDYLKLEKDFELTEEQRNLIDERLDDYEKNPENVISWGESKKRIKKYL